MTGARFTAGAAIGALAAVLLARYGVNVSSADAAAIGAAAAGAGAGLAHVVATEGLWPAVKRLIVGPKKP